MTQFLRTTLMTAAMSLAAGAALAAGTPANTSISNTISLSYDTSSGTVTDNSAASVSFVVDRKVDLGFDGDDALYTVNGAQGDAPVILSWFLENQGNDASGYDIDVNPTGPLALTHDPTGAGALGTYSVYIGTNPGLDAGDVLYDPSGVDNIGDVAADGTRYIKIYAYIPNDAANGDSLSFETSATALVPGTNTVQTASGTGDISTVDTILADEGLNDAANNGIELATETLTVNAPDLSASKTVGVVDENLDGTFDCANTAAGAGGDAVPGACLEYTVTVTNAGTAGAAASAIVITDDLPADLSFASIRDIVNFDTVTESGGTVTGEIATLPIGATASFVIRASID